MDRGSKLKVVILFSVIIKIKKKEKPGILVEIKSSSGIKSVKYNGILYDV